MRVFNTKSYSLTVEEITAVKVVMSLIEDLSEDEDIQNFIENNISTSLERVQDFLQTVLQYDCEKFEP